jgi:succinyl-CoA synthetase alpha subunit
MSVWVGRNTRVVVQGMGRDGSFHAKSMKDYGTQVVAGVSPTKAGERFEGIPLFATLAEAVAKTKANTSIIYVPAAGCADAIYEAIDSGVDLIIAITEGVPVVDMLAVWQYLKAAQEKRGGMPRLIGPNCPGLISPGLCKVGIMPGHIHKPGRIGLVSRSGTLTYEVVHLLTEAGMGQSTCIGIGGDPINGTNFIDALAAFEADPGTDGIVLMGEIGGTDEDEAAAYIRKHVTKPVVAFIAGQTAPPGKRMGHAGAIISGGSGTAAEKIAALRKAGVTVAAIPSEIPGLMAGLLAKRKGKKTMATTAAPKPAPKSAPKKAAKKKAAKPKPIPVPMSAATKKAVARLQPSPKKANIVAKSKKKKLEKVVAKAAEFRKDAKSAQAGLDRARAKFRKSAPKTQSGKRR